MTTTNTTKIKTNLEQFYSQRIECVSPMTYSQKLYQRNELEIAEEYSQALESNSLEKLKILLDKVLELDECS